MSLMDYFPSLKIAGSDGETNLQRRLVLYSTSSLQVHLSHSCEISPYIPKTWSPNVSSNRHPMVHIVGVQTVDLEIMIKLWDDVICNSFLHYRWHFLYDLLFLSISFTLNVWIWLCNDCNRLEIKIYSIGIFDKLITT